MQQHSHLFMFSHTFLLKFIDSEEEKNVYQIQALVTSENERFFLKTTVLNIIMVAESTRYALLFQIQGNHLLKELVHVYYCRKW